MLTRPIRFRVWRDGFVWPHIGTKSEGGWLPHRMVADGKSYYDDHEVIPDDIYEQYGGTIHIEQFTGLTDKNGKDIYEGDVIGMDDRKPDMVVDIGPWEWDIIGSLGPFHATGSGVRYRYVHMNAPYQPLFLTWVHRCYVAGNVHENPELLTAT